MAFWTVDGALVAAATVENADPARLRAAVGMWPPPAQGAQAEGQGQAEGGLAGTEPLRVTLAYDCGRDFADTVRGLLMAHEAKTA